jgi:hypothetical protein
VDRYLPQWGAAIRGHEIAVTWNIADARSWVRWPRTATLELRILRRFAWSCG